jgi:DHA2 family multidrug resistance protein
MHLTSQQVGMMLLPGALVSAVMMPVTAKLLGRFDARMLLAAGALVLAGAVLQLGHLTPMSGEGDFFWPLVLRAIGTVMMFLPLNMATLGPIPKKDVAAASGFFNLTRQLGGSIGVALLTTLLARRQAFHRAVLVEKVGAIAGDAAARVQALAGGLMARGLPAGEAHQRALALLDGTVQAQAAVLSFADTFIAVAVLIIVTLPLVLLLGTVDRGAKVEMGH